jgi:hypothetical protein
MTDRMDLPLEETLDRCLARVLAGESPDAVLRDHAEMDAALRPLLTQAAALRAVSVPAPSTGTRAAAMSRMLAASRDAAEHYQPAGVLAWLGSLRARPLAFQAIAAAIALAVLGSAGLGASAATGTTPEPIRTFFRLPDTSDSSVRAHGTVVSASADALVIDDNSTQVAFLLDANTAVTRGGDHVNWSDLHAGESVDVRATRRANGDLAAHEVRAQAAPAPTASQAGASSTDAAPPLKTSEANRTERPEDGHATGTPNSADDRRGTPDAGGDHRGTPEAETPKPEDGHTAVPGDEHEGTPPQAEATTTHGGPGPSATQTPEPTEVPETQSHGVGEDTPAP